MSAFAKYLILGQGIAGTTLAHKLIEAGQSVWILDDDYQQSSSLVAAGIWNPIVFRRMNKSWMADACIPELYTFYPAIEQSTNTSFFHPKPLIRMHGSKEESDLWLEKRSLPGYAPYFPKLEARALSGFEKTEFGACEVSKTGYVDVDAYLKGSRKYFTDKGVFYQASVDLDQCLNGTLSVGDKSIDFEQVIDCRGAKSAEEPMWKILPFKLTKGEVITVRSSEFKLNAIYNSGGFVLPVSPGVYKVGSTFEWKNLNAEPTEKGLNELTEKLKRWTKLPYTLERQKAGIRPTVKDRRPLIGKHPEVQNLWIFNGLGAKGIMMAPYLAHCFVKHLIIGETLSKDFDISRFF